MKQGKKLWLSGARVWESTDASLLKSQTNQRQAMPIMSLMMMKEDL